MATNYNNPNKVPGRYTEDANSPISRAFPVYEGFVVSNKDHAQTGRIKVRIPALHSLQNIQDNKEDDSTEKSKDQGKNHIDVRFMSPFFGYSDLDRANNAESVKTYDGTVKSYGFVAMPPDIGAPVIVLFIQGNINDGVVIGSPMGNLNHAIPGIGSNVVYNGDKEPLLGPAAERNPKDENTDKNVRPPHRLIKVLERQGLSRDGIRGQSTSSIKRETPSRVFGMLTPAQAQFVMDDGVLEENGKTTEDANKFTGFPGLNSYVRLRTANGGQLLIHDTAEILYLINPSGNAWVEMSQSGKIDVYGRDSISVHSEGDLNLIANKNVNIEGKGINMRAKSDSIKIEAEQGTFEVKASKDLNLTSDLNGNILIAGSLKVQGQRIDMNGPTPATACEPDRFVHSGNRDYKDSIATRVPEHEPWFYHDYQQRPASVQAPVVSATKTNSTEASKATTDTDNKNVSSDKKTVDKSKENIDNPELIAEEKKELDAIKKRIQKQNDIIAKQNLEATKLNNKMANQIINDIVWSPYVTTKNDIPVVGYETPIDALSQGSVVAQTTGETNTVVATGPEKGPITKALSGLGKKIGGVFAPVGKSIDDVLGTTGGAINSAQRSIDNFWATAQGAVDNTIANINAAAAKNLPAGTKFGISHGEAIAAHHTRLTANQKRMRKAYGGRTVVPQRVHDGLVYADYVYGDSVYYLDAQGNTTDIRPLIYNGQYEEAGKVILGDPRNPKKAEEIHNIIVFGQYIEVDLEEKEKLGLRRAAELYFTLNDEQRMQFEIQYYLATGKFPILMDNRRQKLRLSQIEERAKLITPGTNVVSYEQVSVSNFATPSQTIIDTIIDKRKTVGIASFPEGYLFAVAALESNFVDDLVDNDASGLYQFTTAQWNSISSTYDPDGTAYGLQIVGTLDQRTDVEKATVAACLVTNANNGTLQGVLKRSPTQDELYCAHLFGIVDAQVLAKANTNTSLDLLTDLSPNFVTNNATYTKDANNQTLLVGEFFQNLRNQISKISYTYSQLYGV